MAARYSLTIQLADRSVSDKSPGHAAVVVNTPEGQTYAGLGPASHDWKSLYGAWSSPGFDPQTVSHGSTPPRASDPLNYSTVSGHKTYSTFTIPVTEAQAEKALAEIRQIKEAGENYNIFDRRYCTSIVNRIMKAAGLGAELPFAFPESNHEYLSNVEKALRANPNAKYLVDGAARPALIPEAFRGIQRDYAFAGSGYDTPSERVGRVSPGGEEAGLPARHRRRVSQFGAPIDSSTSGPFGTGGQLVSDSSPSPRPLYETRSFVAPSGGPTASDYPQNLRYLSRRVAGKSDSSAFDTGAPAIPFVPTDDDPLVGRPVAFDSRFGAPRGPYEPAPPQAARHLGIVSGKPMPGYPFPPPIWDFSSNPATLNRDGDDWLARLLRGVRVQ